MNKTIGLAAALIALMGAAVYFDGVDDYVIVPGDGVPVAWDFSNGITLSVDLRTTSTLGGWRTIVSVQQGDISAAAQRSFLHLFDDRLAAGIYDSSGRLVSGNGGFAPPDDVWRNYAMTFDGVNLFGYIDGGMVFSEAPTTATQVGSFNGFITYGRNFVWNEPLEGVIDNARVWIVALSAEQIVRQSTTPVDAWGDEELAKRYILTGVSPTPTMTPGSTQTATPTLTATASPTPTATPEPTSGPFRARLEVKLGDEATTRTWTWQSQRDAAIELQDIGLWLWLLDSMSGIKPRPEATRAGEGKR